MNTFARFDEIPRLRSKFAGGGGGKEINFIEFSRIINGFNLI